VRQRPLSTRRRRVTGQSGLFPGSEARWLARSVVPAARRITLARINHQYGVLSVFRRVTLPLLLWLERIEIVRELTSVWELYLPGTLKYEIPSFIVRARGRIIATTPAR